MHNTLVAGTRMKTIWVKARELQLLEDLALSPSTRNKGCAPVPSSESGSLLFVALQITTGQLSVPGVEFLLLSSSSVSLACKQECLGAKAVCGLFSQPASSVIVGWTQEPGWPLSLYWLWLADKFWVAQVIFVCSFHALPFSPFPHQSPLNLFIAVFCLELQLPNKTHWS